MSEEDLELLITLDDPEGAPAEDTFHPLPAENNVEYWLGKPFRPNLPPGNWFDSERI
jgi:hypothetical protein